MNLAEARQSLLSREPPVAAAAAKTVGELGSLTDLSSLIKLTSSGVECVKEAAVGASTKLILENLLTKFSEMKSDMRERLVGVLQALDPRIVDEIAKELYSEDEQRRLRALQILGLFRKHPKLKDILAKLVQDRNERIRATAIALLGKVVGPHDHEVILALLNDKDKRVRANTVEALEALGNKRLVPILQRFRKDPANRIRGNVLKALWNLGYKDIEEDLLVMLTSHDPFMKASCLWVISKVSCASRPLEDLAGQCLLSDNEMVLRNAKTALEAMKTPRAAGYLRYLADAAAAPPVAQGAPTPK